MVFAGAKRTNKPVQATSDDARVNTKAEDKVAEKAVKIDTEVKAEKPKRRRKADK